MILPFSNTMSRRHILTGNPAAISAAVFAPAEEEKSFSALISEFYHEMYGCPISEEELKEVLDVAKEAGVSDETN